MVQKSVSLHYEVFDHLEELAAEDAALVLAARKATKDAYAPYSRFHVAAAARAGDEVVCATNQENASYPVGICAERTLLGVLATQHPGKPVATMAIAYKNFQEGAFSDKPISPCGLCRQSLVEFEIRNGAPIRLLLSGMEGRIVRVASVSSLLPFSFTAEDMK